MGYLATHMIQKGGSWYKKFIDTCFAEVKRVLRPYSDRLLKTQRREMKVIDVVCNIHRYINYAVSVLLGGFLQSRGIRDYLMLETRIGLYLLSSNGVRQVALIFCLKLSGPISSLAKSMYLNT
jgi:hypothetical protein